ncbi:hypothetical protein KKG63_03555 [Patescibacteria group bacterium]|nr:hypothetical protein [Patescibacteria group bacterium]MBU1999460.1 hypothetical protein [Candidatus Omnitrophota bacterium]
MPEKTLKKNDVIVICDERLEKSIGLFLEKVIATSQTTQEFTEQKITGLKSNINEIFNEQKKTGERIASIEAKIDTFERTLREFQAERWKMISVVIAITGLIFGAIQLLSFLGGK